MSLSLRGGVGLFYARLLGSVNTIYGGLHLMCWLRRGIVGVGAFFVSCGLAPFFGYFEVYQSLLGGDYRLPLQEVNTTVDT